MEIYSNTTRFALACNSSEKIIEPIQSRCAILRFTRPSDAQILQRLLQVCELEHVAKSDDGLQTIIYTSEGDMRQALNNLQATVSAFGFASSENVFKVCDQPHPLVVKVILEACTKGDIDAAYDHLDELWEGGYSALDIIGTIFRVAKTLSVPERTKLDFMKEIGSCHMRISEGVGTLLQLSGLLARLCAVAGAVPQS